MSYLDGEIVEKLESPDGRRWVEIIRRSDGTATFVEYFTEYDDYLQQDYTVPSHYSGLYGDTTEARKDLLRQITWLKSSESDSPFPDIP